MVSINLSLLWFGIGRAVIVNYKVKHFIVIIFIIITESAFAGDFIKFTLINSDNSKHQTNCELTTIDKPLLSRLGKRNNLQGSHTEKGCIVNLQSSDLLQSIDFCYQSGFRQVLGRQTEYIQCSVEESQGVWVFRSDIGEKHAEGKSQLACQYLCKLQPR